LMTLLIDGLLIQINRVFYFFNDYIRSGPRQNFEVLDIYYFGNIDA
jgi:hypothetical protein